MTSHEFGGKEESANLKVSSHIFKLPTSVIFSEPELLCAGFYVSVTMHLHRYLSYIDPGLEKDQDKDKVVIV